MLTTVAEEYATRPCYPELIAIIVVGLLHVVTELASSDVTARLYNAVASIAFGIYLVWRVRQGKEVLRTWGMRCDNLWLALRAQLPFAVIAVLALMGFAAATGALRLPESFWITLALYPIWGIAQQFALQNLIGNNLTGLFSRPAAIAGVSCVLFGASHYPRLELVLLTLVGGFFFTLIYRRIPNLWAVGIVHGILGSLVIYIVLKEDPGATLLRFVSSR
jgi:hypothetical protein